MRTADPQISPPRSRRNWVTETLVVAGIVAFGLFVLVLEGQFNPLAQPRTAVDLPFDLTR